jgi:hypothetical protein
MDQFFQYGPHKLKLPQRVVDVSKNELVSEGEENEIKMGELDRMTMELLLNKTHYAKYLAKTDHQKYEEFQQFRTNLALHRESILDMTTQLIASPKSPQFTEEMTTAFQTYAHTVLRFLELSVKEQEPEHDES